jgi:very-short-patch-repair endonuclease
MNFYRSDLLKKSQVLRKNMTPQERRLWYCFLKSYRPRFYRQKPMLSYILDFYCPKARTAIELDGSQHYEDEALTYDERREQELRNIGIVVLRYTNRQINESFADVCQNIDETIKSERRFSC